MRINKNYVLREIAGDYILIPTGNAVLKFNGLVTLNEVGVSIWKLLSDGRGSDLDSLVAGILEEYDVDEETAREDVSEFLDKLVEADILEREEE